MSNKLQILKKAFVGGCLVIAGVTVSLFLCDWTLGLLGFPSDLLRQLSHPANHEEVRRNLEFEYVFRTNSQGLRYHEVQEEKPANEYRVFVSGDSFAEGYGIDDGDRFTDLLESRFQSPETNVSFINGGLAGTGPLEYGRLFLEVGLKYRPDAVLICVFVNDVAGTPGKLSPKPFSVSVHQPGVGKIARTLWPRIYAQLKSYYWQRTYFRRTRTTDFVSTISQRARKRDIPERQIERWKRSLPPELVSAVNQGMFNGSILSNGLLYPEVLSDSIDISSARAEKKWTSMTSLLTEMIQRAEQNGVESAVILLPSPHHYDPASHGPNNPYILAGIKVRDEWLSEETVIQKRMSLWALEEGVSFLDLTPVFRQAIRSNGEFNLELDGHWNSQGHLVAADAIESWLEDQQVFSFMGSKSQPDQ